MPNIDNNVVQMTFDNQQFEREISQSRRSIDDLKKNLDFDKVASGISVLGNAFQRFDLSGITDSVEDIQEKFSALGILGVTVMERIANAAVDAGVKIVKALSIDNIGLGEQKYETRTKAVRTIMASTGKSLEEVEKVLDRLMKYTDETSYDFSTMVQSIGKFTNAGVELEVAERAMEGITNEAAQSGASIQEANRAMYNFAQSLAMGSVKLMDWKSIENANMATKQFKEELIKTAIAEGTLKKEGDAVGSIMKQTKKSTKKASTETEKATVNYKNFSSTLSSGWLSSDVLIKTLEKYADTNTKLGKEAFEAAKMYLTWGDVMDTIRDSVSSGWMQTFQYLFGNLEEAKQLWTRVGDSILSFTSIFTEARNNLLKGWHELGGYNSAVEAAANTWHTFMVVVEAVKEVVEEFIPKDTVQRFVDLTKNLEKRTAHFEKIVRKYIDRIKSIIRGAVSTLLLVKDVVTTVIGIIRKAIASLKPVIDPVIKTLSLIGSMMTNLRKNFRNSILPKAIEKINSVIRSLIRLVNTVSGIIKKFIKRYEEFIEKIGDGSASISNFLKFIKSEFGKLRIGKSILQSVEHIKRAYKIIVEIIDSIVTNVKRTINFIRKALKFKRSPFVNIISTISKIASTVIHIVTNIIEIIAWASKLIYNYVHTLITHLVPIITPILKIIGYISYFIANTVIKIKKIVEGIRLNKKFTEVASKIAYFIDRVVHNLNTFLDNFHEFMQETEDRIINLPNTLAFLEKELSKSGIGSILLSIINSVKSIIESLILLVSLFKGAFDGLVSAISGNGEKISTIILMIANVIAKAIDIAAQAFVIVKTVISRIVSLLSPLVTPVLNLIQILLVIFRQFEIRVIKGLKKFKIGNISRKLKPLTNSIKKIADAIDKFVQNFKEFSYIGTTVDENGKKLIHYKTTVSKFLRFLNEELGKSSIGRLIWNIVNHIRNSYIVVKNIIKSVIAIIDNVSGIIHDNFSSISKIVLMIISIITNVISVAGIALGNILQIVNEIIKVINPIIQPILDLFVLIGDVINDLINSIVKYFASFDIDGFRKKLEPLARVIDAIATAINGLIDRFKSFFYVGSAVDESGKKIDKYKVTFSGFLRFMEEELRKTKIGQFVLWFIEQVSPIVNGIFSIFDELTKSIPRKLDYLTRIFGEIDLFKWLEIKLKGSQVGRLILDGIDKIKSAFETVKGVFESISKSISRILNSVSTDMEKSETTAGSVFTTIQTVFGFVVSNIGNALNILAKAFSITYNIISTVVSYLKPLIKPISEIVKIISAMIGNLFFDANKKMQDFDTKSIIDKFKPLKEIIDKVSSSITGFIDRFKKFSTVKVTKNGKTYYTQVYSFAKLFEFLKQELNKSPIGKIIVGIIDKIQPVVTKLFKLLGTIKDGIIDFFANLSKPPKSGNAGALGIFDKLKESFSGVAEWFKKAFGGKGQEGAKEAGKGIDIFQVIGEKVKKVVDFLKGINLAQLALFAFAIYSAYNIFQAIKGPTQIVKNVTGMTKGIADMIKGRNKQRWLETIGEFARNIGIAVGLLAASIYALSQLDPGKAWSSVGMIAVLMGMMVGVAILMKKIDVGGIETKGFMTFSATILMLSIAVEKLANLPFDKMMGAMLALTILLGEVVIFNKLMKGEKFTVGGLTDMGIGIGMLVGALDRLSKLKTEDIKKGLVGLGALLLELGVFLRLTNNSKFKTGPLAMIGIGLSILLMAKAFSSIAKLDWQGILKGIVGLGAIFLELGLFLKLTSGFGSSKGLFGMIGIGIAILLISKAFSGIAKLQTKEILKGIIGLGAIFLEVAIFMKLIHKRNPAAMAADGFAMIGIGISLGLITLSFKALGKMKGKAILKGVIALGAIFLEVAVFMKMIHKRNPVAMAVDALALVGIGAALGLVTISFRALGKMKGKEILKGVIALGAIFLEIAAFMKLVKGSTSALAAIPTLIVIAGSLLIFALALSSLTEIPWNTILAFAVSFNSVMTAITGSMAVLSKIPITESLLALANLDLFIANLVLILGAFAGLQKLTGGAFGEWMETGAEVIGRVIGGFIGGIISGINKNKQSTQKKTLADYIKDFLNDIKSVIPTMKQLSGEAKNMDTAGLQKVADAMGYLVKITGSILGVKVINALSKIPDFLTNSNNLQDFINDLEALMPYVVKLAKTKAVDNERLKNVADAMSSVATIALSILTTEIVGLLSNLITFNGQYNNLQTFIDHLKAIMPYVKGLSTTKSVDTDRLKNVADAMKSVSDIAFSILKTEIISLLSNLLTFNGEKDNLKTFIDNLKLIMPSVTGLSKLKSVNASKLKTVSEAMGYVGNIALGILKTSIVNLLGNLLTFNSQSENLSGFIYNLKTIMPVVSDLSKVKDINVSRLKNITEALGQISAMALESLKVSWADWATNITSFLAGGKGDNAIISFVDRMKEVAPKLVELGNKAKDINIDNVKKAATALGALAEAARQVPESNGLVQVVIGDHDLDTFGKDLEVVGEGLSKFSKSTEGIPSDYDTSGPVKAVTALAELESGLESHGGIVQWFTGDKNLADFGNGIGILGENLKTFFNSTVDVDDTKITNLGKGLQSLSEAVSYAPDTSTMSQGLFNLQGVLDGIPELDYSNITSIGEEVIKFLKTGIVNKEGDAVDEITTLGDGMEEILKGYYDEFESTGKYLVDGLIKGLKDNLSLVKSAAEQVAWDAYLAAKKKLKIESPSKEGSYLGQMFDEGISVGLQKYSDKVGDSSESAANGAIDSASKAFNGLNQVIDSDIDTQPVIRPVLDASELRQGIDNEMDYMQSRSASANLNIDSSGRRAQNLAQDMKDSEKLAILTNSVTIIAKKQEENVLATRQLGERITELEGSIASMKLYLDGDALVGGIIGRVDSRLGSRRQFSNRGVTI